MTEKRYCFLIVDDEEDFRGLMKLHFEDLGYEVLEARDGVEALEVFARHGDRIDLVITDIRMPRMDGERLIRELRSRVPHLSIIGITGHTELHETLRAVDEGAYFYLHKPLDPWPIVERLVDNAVRFYQTRKKELEIARLLRTYIAESSTPPRSSRHMGHAIRLDIAAQPIDRLRPSGDFAEWFSPSTDEVCFYISDSSGHDDLLPSFLACLGNMVLHRCHQGCRPRLDEIVVAIDRAVGMLQRQGALPNSKYLTAFIGQVRLDQAELDYVCAGHPAALLVRPGKNGAPASHLRLGEACRPLGYLFNQTPRIERLALRPGDVLLVYTDGASELLQGDDDEAAAGFDRLGAFLQPLLDLPAREIVQRLEDELLRFAGTSGLPDDTTLLAIKVLDAE